jgi:pimeloyl-ACP methyl ester carboxylesterase
MTTTDGSSSTALTSDGGAGVIVSSPLGDVHVKIDGDPGADVVACFIHGLPGSTRDFVGAARALASRGGCAVRLDLPGFGRSPPSPTLLRTAEARADLVAAVMRARGHRRYAVVAHSFGGTAALALAGRPATSPSITALVMVAAVGITRHRGLSLPHELTGALAGVYGVPIVGPRLGAPLVARFRAVMERLGVRGDRPFTDAELVEHATTVGGLDFVELRRFAKAVRAPALVVSAHDDRVVHTDVSFTLAAALTDASIVSHHHRRVGGHFLQRKVGDVIADWLMTLAR